MNNLVEIVGLTDILEEAGVKHGNQNFEALYSSLAADSENDALLRRIEGRVFDYFAAMRLPDPPSLYDHLVLSLRAKDVIVTFNWDPFLIQAIGRTQHIAPPPSVLFLHGNVALGFCIDHRPALLGNRGSVCSTCGRAYQPSRLLYPVSEKNYSQDPFLAMAWRDVQGVLKNAFLLTIFGYGAPESDVEAVELLRQGWGEKRQFEEIEIIDIKPEDELRRTWEPFIFGGHYQAHRSFYDTLLARAPRRSCEQAWQMLMMARFTEDDPIPKAANWPELQAWIASLEEQEHRVG